MDSINYNCGLIQIKTFADKYQSVLDDEVNRFLKEYEGKIINIFKTSGDDYSEITVVYKED